MRESNFLRSTERYGGVATFGARKIKAMHSISTRGILGMFDIMGVSIFSRSGGLAPCSYEKHSIDSGSPAGIFMRGLAMFM